MKYLERAVLGNARFTIVTYPEKNIRDGENDAIAMSCMGAIPGNWIRLARYYWAVCQGLDLKAFG